MLEESPEKRIATAAMEIARANPGVTVTEGFSNANSGYSWSRIRIPGSADDHPGLKMILSPGVYMVGHTVLNRPAVDEFLADHQITTFSPWGEPGDRNGRGTDHELMVELSGRVCYMSYEKPRPGGCATFVDNIRAEGHGSVFEHPHYSFLLTGISRNLSLEANRHRTFSISQLSGRFVNGEEVGMVVDPNISGADLQSWALTCDNAMAEYQHRYKGNYARELRRWWQATGVDQASTPEPDKKTERKLVKKARERARDILPGCLETRCYYTVNARAIRFILEKRCHADAAWEIRRVFNRVFLLLRQHDPKLFSDYTVTHLDDGTFAVHTPHGKI